MGFKRFSMLIIIRVLLILLTIVGLFSLSSYAEHVAGTLLILLILLYQIIEMYRFVSKTNQELSRFLESARYADFSQRFELSGVGAGFEELGNAFTDILKRFQSVRSEQEKELKYLKAMLELIPVPLLTIEKDQQIRLLNNSARRLFSNYRVTKVTDLEQFGNDLCANLQQIKPGEKRLINFDTDGMTQQLTVSTTEVTIGQQHEKLISLQDIQSELDAAQLQAWQDLVRVLTHELMNSITPVASLAKTAVDLVEDAKLKMSDREQLTETLDDVANAVGTVARRSDGLMTFIRSYRQLTRLSVPNRRHIKVSDIIDNAIAIAGYNWDQIGIKLTLSVRPSELEILVDKNMIEQVLINLLKNATQAMANTTKPLIAINSRLNKAGRVIVEIQDNGPGISEEIINKVFVPFFTTKRDGSGVGLAFSRQVMIAHGGNLKLDSNDEEGAKFILTF